MARFLITRFILSNRTETSTVRVAEVKQKYIFASLARWQS